MHSHLPTESSAGFFYVAREAQYNQHCLPNVFADAFSKSAGKGHIVTVTYL